MQRIPATGLLLTILFVYTSSVKAQDGYAEASSSTPIQLALFNPVQIYPETHEVKGFRLSLYGVNRKVVGFDLGVVNRTNGDSTGFQLGIVGVTLKKFTGLQHNLGANLTKELVGAQLSYILNMTEKAKGAKIGAVNISDEIVGGELAFVNVTERVKGIQVGIVNVVDENLHGIQIGLVNVANNGFLPVFPIVNWAFSSR